MAVTQGNASKTPQERRRDRRRYQRFEALCPVRWQGSEGVVRDLSVGGMRLEGAGNLLAGTTLTFTLDLPDEPLAAEGIVVFRDAQSVRVAFVGKKGEKPPGPLSGYILEHVVRDLEHQINGGPEDAEVIPRLAGLYRDLGRLDNGLSLFSSVVDVMPFDDDFVVKLCDFFLTSAQLNHARAQAILDLLDDILRRIPEGSRSGFIKQFREHSKQLRQSLLSTGEWEAPKAQTGERIQTLQTAIEGQRRQLYEGFRDLLEKRKALEELMRSRPELAVPSEADDVSKHEHERQVLDAIKVRLEAVDGDTGPNEVPSEVPTNCTASSTVTMGGLPPVPAAADPEPPSGPAPTLAAKRPALPPIRALGGGIIETGSDEPDPIDTGTVEIPAADVRALEISATDNVVEEGPVIKPRRQRWRLGVALAVPVAAIMVLGLLQSGGFEDLQQRVMQLVAPSADSLEDSPQAFDTTRRRGRVGSGDGATMVALADLPLEALPNKRSQRRRTRAQGMRNKEQRALNMRQRGWLLLQQKKAVSAKEAFRKVLTEFPEDVAAHEGLGRAYLMLGRADEAMAAFRRFVTLAPHHPQSRFVRSIIARHGRKGTQVAGQASRKKVKTPSNSSGSAPAKPPAPVATKSAAAVPTAAAERPATTPKSTPVATAASTQKNNQPTVRRPHSTQPGKVKAKGKRKKDEDHTVPFGF